MRAGLPRLAPSFVLFVLVFSFCLFIVRILALLQVR